MPWQWPWSRGEAREAGGDYSAAILALAEAEANGTSADVTRTAAVEAAAGLLSRAFASAEVEGPGRVAETVNPGVLAQIGRDLVRNGESLHVIRMSGGGLRLLPAASWHWEGDHDPDNWRCRVTAYGPSTSTTWTLPASSVVFARWGGFPGSPYLGTSPIGWASTTARLGAEAERSLADEASGPLANLLAVPGDGGDDEEGDPLLPLKANITKARGKALLVETTAAGHGEGRAAAPARDWVPSRLGPTPPAAVVEVARDAFARTLAACGCSPALFDDSDGTSKREGLRQWHLGTVRPLARMIEVELSEKLETRIRLRFDSYPLDLQARAASLQKLVAAGMSRRKAERIVGLLADE